MSARACEVCAESLDGKSVRAKFCSKSCAYKAWYAAHREEQRARINAAYHNNPSKGKAATTRWKLAHRTRTQELARESYARNPETAKRSARARRAREAGAETLVYTTRDWLRIVAHYDGRCAWCGVRGPLTRDHVIPLARGGRHSIGNIVPACGSCNSSRRDRLVVEWRHRARHLATA